eukprot:scaffold361_cov248-Pinguiococcus_pyrenoidosus.AAC.8
MASQISSSQSNFESRWGLVCGFHAEVVSMMLGRRSRKRKPNRRRTPPEEKAAEGPDLPPGAPRLKVETRSLRERMNSKLGPEECNALRAEMLRYARTPGRKEWSHVSRPRKQSWSSVLADVGLYGARGAT